MPVSCLQELPEGSRVVRMMPNTPALVQNAASVFCRGTNTLPEDGETVHNIVSTFGICEEMEEKHLDAVTGLSGSGPAFVSKCIHKPKNFEIARNSICQKLALHNMDCSLTTTHIMQY